MTLLEPLRFTPIFIHKPWGGRRLEAFKGSLPEGDIGETWDVSAHPQGDTVVVGGPYHGRTLSQIVAQLDARLVGTRNAGRPFPVMVRYVSSRENLSVQLHPTKSYARKKGEPSGKDEAWYVLDAAPDAFVYAGLEDTTVAGFREAAEGGTLPALARRRPVRAGDFLYVPAGTVHAICAGITLIEICENSNTTYRLFDYGRDRGLDLQDGFEVVDVDAVALPHRGLASRGDGHTVTRLCLTERFAISKIDIETTFEAAVDTTTFQILTCVAGDLIVSHASGSFGLVPGESTLLPAGLGHYRISGVGAVLETHVPDLAAERAELAGLLT